MQTDAPKPEVAVPCTGWVEEGTAHDYTDDDQIKLGWDELRGMQERARHYANLATATKGERRMAANLLKCCEWIEAEGRAVETERRCSSTLKLSDRGARHVPCPAGRKGGGA